MGQIEIQKEHGLLLPATEFLDHGSVTLRPSSDVQTRDQRKILLASLRGQKIRVPNLKPLFQHWPTETNQFVDPMRQDVRIWLNDTMAPGRSLDAFQASDFGLMSSTWWPCASFDKLRIVTYLITWLFIWDDEIDLSDGTLWNEFGQAQTYREQTIAYVRYSLGIDSKRPVVQNEIILNFEPIGVALCENYTLEKRHLFLKELVYFMQMSEEEQRLRLSGSIASLDEFWRYRLGSSAVTACLALNEFSWQGMDLPTEFYDDKDVLALFRYTNTLISAVNDLLSIKKEIKRDAIDSLIPIIFFHVNDIQTAVQQVVAFIQVEIRAMDEAAESLSAKYRDFDAATQQQVSQFIDGCKFYVTGNLTWSLKTDRYDVGRLDEASGDVIMTL